MVLEDIPATTSSDFEDSAPASDEDAYSPETSKAQYQIDGSNFPRPMPLFGPLLGYTQQWSTVVATRKIAALSQALNRPLSNEEANACAYWTAKQVSILSYGPPIGIAAGLWRFYDTRSTFRFPFIKPNLDTFDINFFPHRKIPLLQHQLARTAWNTVRLSAYVALSVVISDLLFSSYSISVSTVGEMSDKRLKPMMEVLRSRTQQRRGGLPRPPGQYTQEQKATPSANSQADDASPTGGMLWGNEEPSPTATTQSQSSGPQWTPTRPSPVPTQFDTSSQDKPYDLFDDASPTAGQSMNEDVPTSQGGSAWDRLRRGQKPATRPSTTGPQGGWQKQQSEARAEPKQGSTTGDSFAFSKTEEERNYAKEIAQKEFDARVEQERRGGDFSTNGGD